MPRPRPNFLLITTDQQRADALGIHGNRILQTPNLDHLAATGVHFTRAYSTCPVCIPARRSLLTGLHPETHGLRRYQDGLDWEPPFTLPGILGSNGYQTQLIGKLHLHPPRKRYGFDHMIRSDTESARTDSTFTYANDYLHWLKARGVSSDPQLHGVGSNSRVARPHYLEESLHHNSWLAEEACRFLTETKDPTLPWFLHLSFVAPHPPLTPPALYYERYRRRIADLSPRPRGKWVPQWAAIPPGISPEAAYGPFDPEEIAEATAGYYGLINHIDDCVARVLESCFRYGTARAADPVYLLFTSDHGEMLGDHELFRKSLPYEGSTHIPLLISGRNVDIASQSSDALVGLEDLPPTILELAGITPPPEMTEGLNGRSLARVLRGEPCVPRTTLYGSCGGRSEMDHYYLVHDRWKYICYLQHHEEQLFDLEADPGECNDLSGDEALLSPLRAKMIAHLDATPHRIASPEQLVPLNNRPPTGFWPGRGR